MKYFVWLCVLILWLVVMSTMNATALLSKKCTKDADCNVISQTCHGILKICVRKRGPSTVLTRRNQRTTCNKCLANEYCHEIFKRCLPRLSIPSPRNNKKPTALDCKHNRDCTTNKYCHKTFKKCLDIPVIPTMSTAKTSTQPCRNDSTCGKNRYCHDFFKICLVRPTVYQNVTTPRLKYGCKRDKDCQSGQYCRNVTNTCQQVLNLSGNGAPSAPSKYSRCKTDSDCSKREICSRSLGQRVSVGGTQELRRNCSSGLGCSQTRWRLKSTGVCTTRMVEFHPPVRSCNRDGDCGTGMCCLTKLGLCKRMSTRRQPCVTQAVDFTCPCSTNLYCKSNPRKRKVKGKRLERRLKLSMHIRRQLKKRGLIINKKYVYGRCHKISS